MLLPDLAARLRKSRRKIFKNGAEGFVGSCPCPRHAHGDNSLSLAVWIGEDSWIHVKCAGGCSEDEILSALGLTQEDRKPEPFKQDTGPSKVYVYRDDAGHPLFEKCRFDQGNGKKTFRVRAKRPDGSYVWNLAHLNGQSTTLFNLPEVKEAVASGKTIYINEGEKACEEFGKRGLVATCQPWGADENSPERKWLPEHTKVIQGAKNVVIVADRDSVGVKYASYIATQLEGLVESVQVVQSACVAEKADAYDHLTAGKGVEEFVPLPKQKPAQTFLRSYADVEVKPVDWLWSPYIERGNITILAGDPGIGKSFFSLALATAISLGEGPPGFPKRDAGDVVLCCTEDEAEQDIRPRLDALGADVKHIFDVFDPSTQDRLSPPITPEKMELVIGLVKKLPNPQLVIFDPISEWFPATRNMNAANEARDVTRLFRTLGKECRVSALLVGHPNKGNGPLLYRFQASIDFTAIVRSALYAAEVPETKERVVMHVKTNHSIRGKAIGYHIDDTGRFSWTGAMDVNEDQLRQAANAPVVTTKQRESAYEWLLSALKDGPVESKELFEGAKAAGHSRATLFRVKAEHPDVKCVSRRDGSAITGWEWVIDRFPARQYWQDKEDDPYAD